MKIRHATQDDLPALLEIHNHAVRHLMAVWSEDEETLAQRQQWLEKRQAASLPVLVAVDETGTVLGYASYGPFRDRSGYRLTVEHSVYTTPGHYGKGVGRRLMQALIHDARAAGYHAMVGAIDGENEGSINFHQKIGFEVSGRMPQVGLKFGRWLDLVLMTLLLSEDAAAPRR